VERRDAAAGADDAGPGVGLVGQVPRH
jgi:hypothetical protein